MLRHPQQLCIWSRRGFASPQSALSSSYCFGVGVDAMALFLALALEYEALVLTLALVLRVLALLKLLPATQWRWVQLYFKRQLTWYDIQQPNFAR